MASYTYYTQVTRRRVYEITLPTDRDEMYKMLTGANNDWHKENPDKTIAATDLLIDSDGEKLYISFEISQEEK